MCSIYSTNAVLHIETETTKLVGLEIYVEKFTKIPLIWRCVCSGSPGNKVNSGCSKQSSGGAGVNLESL